MSLKSSGPRKRLRRGLWSPEEDAKLMGHVSMYGHDCWSYVPKAAGIERGGKSCRLRWLNYLRPGLKKVAFSVEEEDLIVRLHSILGNRWSRIAARLPGRTDNEVKNFWHSFVKKKLRLRGIDPVTHKPLATDTARRPTAVFSEPELILPSVGQRHHVLHAPQATPESYKYIHTSSTDGGASARAHSSVVVRGCGSDVSMVPSRCTQTGDFTCYLELDTGALQCVCVPSGIVHPALVPVVSSSNTVCSTAGLSSTCTGATIEQCNDDQPWLEPGWMGTCTAAADNYGAGVTLDELKWSDCVFDADYQLHY